MWKKIFLVSISSVFYICSAADAGRMWINKPIEIDGMPIHSQSCALAMRSGSTWPVISYSEGPQARTAAMTPVGWVSGPATGNIKYGISSATSPDGTAGFAYDNGSVLLLNRTGWSTYSYGSGTTMGAAPSIAFKNNNTPSVLHNTGGYGDDLTLASFNGQGWSQDTLRYENGSSSGFRSRAFALGYDSYGQANVAFENSGRLMFGLKGVLTQNQWSFSSIDEYYVHPDPFRIDMAIGAGDIPWVAYTQQGYLRYATYNIQQQSWIHGILGQAGSVPGALPGSFSMSADSRGGIGVAYVGINNMLTLVYNDGSGSWTYDIGIAEGWGDVSLAFDSRNNPVICYTDSRDGFLHLAYDPSSVPEPGTLSLLIFGAGFFISAKKRKYNQKRNSGISRVSAD
jgi:hypothetical protein